MAEERITLLCHDMLGELEAPLELGNGTILPKGSRVLLLPQTIAECVLTPDGKSLAEAWPELSREGHSHAELAEFSAQIIRFSTRLAAVESKLAELEVKN